MSSDAKFLVLEPFYGGSHKQLINTVFDHIEGVQLFTLPAKKWHWKARISSLKFSQLISKPVGENIRTVFSSSVLNLAELVALRPDLATCRKILYFHENQLEYPVRKDQNRDFQYGYNQILSCLVADLVLFNSAYNMNSFLASIPSFLKQIPDNRPDAEDIVSAIRSKCQVLYFAMQYPKLELYADVTRKDILHIVWPHRWEHDKDPDLFFEVLKELKEGGHKFKVSVLGEQYQKNPDIFEEMRTLLSDEIIEWGYQESKDSYYRVLCSAHIVVSTAKHEFFGVAMLEAVHLGCYPLAPNKLVYPEHFPEVCLYNTKAQLAKKLRYFCKHPEKTRTLQLDVSKYSWQNLKPEYDSALNNNSED